MTKDVSETCAAHNPNLLALVSPHAVQCLPGRMSQLVDESVPTPQPSSWELVISRAAAAASADSVSCGSTGDARTSRLLHQSEDALYLSDLYCFLRLHIEVFVTTADELEMGGGSIKRCGSGAHVLGQVGMRCVHCALRRWSGDLLNPNGSKLPRGAVSYPQSIRLFYQAVRNWQRYHLAACPAMPIEVKMEYVRLKSNRTRSCQNAPRYWEECCRRMGIVDASGGIRLRNGYFEDIGDCGPGAFDEQVARRSTSSGLGSPNMDAPSTQSAVPTAVGSVYEIESAIITDRLKTLTDSTNKIPTGVGRICAHRDFASNGERGVATHMQHDGSVSPSDKRLNGSSSDLSPGLLSQPQIVPEPINPSLSIKTSMPSERLGYPSLRRDNDKRLLQTSEGQTGWLPLFNQIGHAIPFKKDDVVEKVTLALSVVRAIREIRHVPPSQPSSPNKAGNESNVYEVIQEDQNENDLRYIGAELYELFSGRSLCSDFTSCCEEKDDQCNLDATVDDGYGAGQRNKKEKRPNMPRYDSLSESGLPPVLCGLVSGLLEISFSSGKRSNYESIGDVEEDLRFMLSRAEKLLREPTPTSLCTPNILYGREEEVDQLLEAFSRATDTSRARRKEIVLLSGYSGTGKSSLVDHARHQFSKEGACFVSGKFDAMQQLQPLSAIISAIDDYCSLLGQDEDRIGVVREAVSSAIGSEGSGMLASLLPNLGKIVGPSDDNRMAAQVNGREALNCLVFMVRMLFQTTCSPRHPVVLFLDDVHWADEMSIMLMYALVTDTTIEGLLFVMSYRDNEVGEDHPLEAIVGDIRRLGSIALTSICIGNLDVKSVSSMLSDMLRLTPLQTRYLAEVVWKKTGGNALFVHQFLASLVDEGMLLFSYSSRRWEWDLDSIQNKDIARNVAELMTAKLRRMVPDVLDALKLAAAFGAQCQEDILRIIDRDQEEVGRSITDCLEKAVAEGLMDKIGSVFKFSHDQIQHAAYLLLPEIERNALHLRIGRLLRKWASQEELRNFAFIVVDQLHRGSSLISEREEKVAFARLSLMAGKMAAGMSAFAPAAVYLNAGINMLSDEDWKDNRDLCLCIYNMCYEAEYVVGDFDAMKGHINEVLKRGQTLQEKLPGYFILIQAMGAQGHANDAIGTALQVISYLGDTMPANVIPSTVEKEIAMTIDVLKSETADSLQHLKSMNDSDKLQEMKFLHILMLYVFSARKSYFPFPVCRMVRLTVIYGVCRESAFAFACYAIILCRLESKFSEAYRFGKLAVFILNRFKAKEQTAKVYLCVYGFVNHWTEPIQSCLPPLKHAIDVGLANGDTSHSMFAALALCSIALTSGQELNSLLKVMDAYSEQMKEFKQHLIRNLCKPMHQTMMNLLGRSENPIRLVGGVMDEDSFLGNSTEKSELAIFLCRVYRLWLEYLFGEYKLAWETRKQCRDTSSNVLRALFPVLILNVLYSCLTAVALARIEAKAEYFETIDHTLRQMKDWAMASKWNCENKLELMKAEYAFLKGDFVSASESYSRAIDLAADHHFIHEQALALERSGIFHLGIGDFVSASDLFVKAHDCYVRWGACSKAAQVKELYI